MQALNDRVICKLSNMPEKTKGGVILPVQNFQDGEAKINIGKVLSAGDGLVLRNGEVIKVKVKPGDVIVWEQFGALRFEILGPRTVCIRSEDIGAVLDKGEYDDGWFEEFDGGQASQNKDATLEFKEKMDAVDTGRQDKCSCEIICNECGNKVDIELPWLDINLASVDDSSLPVCERCEKRAMKVSKKNINLTGHVSGGTPVFHQRRGF